MVQYWYQISPYVQQIGVHHMKKLSIKACGPLVYPCCNLPHHVYYYEFGTTALPAMPGLAMLYGVP